MISYHIDRVFGPFTRIYSQRKSVMPHHFKFAFLFLGALALSAGAYAADPQGKTKIGASYMTLNNIFFDPMNAGASEAAKKEGADYVVVDARLDISRQIALVMRAPLPVPK
jgi:ABC-type sugar transport system substrate-binding protein